MSCRKPGHVRRGELATLFRVRRAGEGEEGERRQVAYQDGPFTLYREAPCRAEFEVFVPRSAVKEKDASTDLMKQMTATAL